MKSVLLGLMMLGMLTGFAATPTATGQQYFITADQLEMRPGGILAVLETLIPGAYYVRNIGEDGHSGLILSAMMNANEAIYILDGTTYRPPLPYVHSGDVACVQILIGSSAAERYRRSINQPRASGVIIIWTYGNRSKCNSKRPH